MLACLRYLFLFPVQAYHQVEVSNVSDFFNFTVFLGQLLLFSTCEDHVKASTGCWEKFIVAGIILYHTSLAHLHPLDII